MAPTDPPPSLAQLMTRLAGDMGDVQGQILHGARWPEVKAELQLRVEQAERDAAAAAKAQRRARLARAALVIYALVCLSVLAPALAIMAWRAAL